jgi:integrase
MRFTTQSINSLAPKPREYLVFEDRGIPKGGRLAVRVRPAGNAARKEFLFVYRVGGRRRKLSLGDFGDPHQGAVSLGEARARYARLSEQLRSGLDPIAAREAEQEAAEAVRRERASQGSLEELAAAYLASLEARGARSARNIRYALDSDVYPVIPKGTRARDVGPEHVRQVLRRLVARGSRAQANRVRGYLQTIFAYGLKHDQSVERPDDSPVLFGLERNPARDVPNVDRRGATGVRDVELTSEQLRRLWQAIEAQQVGALPDAAYGRKRVSKRPSEPRPVRLDPSIGACLQLLIATGGQRVEVAAGARRSEFNLQDRLWTVPHERRKNRLHSRGPHVIPLNDTAVAIVEAQLARSGDSEFLFPALRGSQRAPHLSIDVIYRGLKRWCTGIGFPAEFAPRDLRQTWMSRAGEIGLSKEIRDRIQDRPPTDVGAKHYDRYDYLDKIREALDAWDERLREILVGAPVVPIRRKQT